MEIQRTFFSTLITSFLMILCLNNSFASEINLLPELQLPKITQDTEYGSMVFDKIITDSATIVIIPAPTNLIGIVSSSKFREVYLNWKDNSANETGFRIELRIGNAGPFFPLTTIGANITTYRHNGLLLGKTYYYRVKAFNSSGNSSYSNIISITPK